MKKIQKNERDWAKWNDKMVKKYHAEGTLFESKNPITRLIEIWRLRTIKRLADYSVDDAVLDLGCGEGFYIKTVKKPKEIVGIDISKVALKRAMEINHDRENVRFFLGNAENLPVVKNETFDKITTSEMLEHVPNPKKVLKEIYRILKDKGTLIVSVPDEMVIQKIVRIINFLGLGMAMKAARKQEEYEWHLHESSLSWLEYQVKELFVVEKVVKIPPFLGYRLIVRLKKRL